MSSRNAGWFTPFPTETSTGGDPPLNLFCLWDLERTLKSQNLKNSNVGLRLRKPSPVLPKKRPTLNHCREELKKPVLTRVGETSNGGPVRLDQAPVQTIPPVQPVQK
jgi:hypothetical protein